MKLKAGLLFFLYLYLKVSLNGPMSFSFLNAGALFYKFFFSIFRGPQATAYLASRLGRPCV